MAKSKSKIDHDLLIDGDVNLPENRDRLITI